MSAVCFMKVLGIDTATAIASAAIVENGRLVLEETFRGRPHRAFRLTDRGNHAESLLPLIDTVLRKAALSLTEISALAASIGPGSFTGLRIGLSTIKGLAYGWEIPVVGVPTLLAIAARVTDWDGLICPFLDARKKEVYAALFHKKGEALDRLTQDMVSSPERIIELVRSASDKRPCLFIGDGTRVYGDLIEASLDGHCVLTLGDLYPSTAYAVARLGEERLKKNECDALGPLVPLYLRPSEAELKRAGSGAKL